MKRPDLAHWIMLAIILILGFYLWLTPYHYEKGATTVVRINRFTGEADILKIDGWHRLERSSQRSTSENPFSELTRDLPKGE